MKLYAEISSKLMAIDNCIKSQNWEWKERHEEVLAAIIDTAPSGSGIDNGIELLVSESTPEKLVFSCDFHHMNDAGFYDGWTEHKVIITPSFYCGINIRITGRDRNDIKDYLADVFSCWLNEETPVHSASIA